MAFNPLDQRGIPLDDQVRNWSELNVEPYDKDSEDPLTKCRIIAMNGIEVESILFSHQFNRHCDVPEIRERLAEIRRIETQQQKAVNWLTPGEESTIEYTIAYEQLAVELTAWVAQQEPDPYLKQTYDFGLLEDFDHLYRYANLYELLERKQAQSVIDQITEVMPGRPTVNEHRHPVDNVRKHMDRHTAESISQLHALTIMSAEQQTMNFYMNLGNRYMEPIARGLYLEIAQVEEEHVTQYESLLDSGMTWLEMLAMHEYNECYMYYSFAQQETDERVRKVWDLHLGMEIEHLHQAVELLRKYEGKEPEQVLPLEVPEPVLMRSNKPYIRQVLAEQCDLNALGTGYVWDAHTRFQENLAKVNAGGVPSEQVVERVRERDGRDYRWETEGPHPIEEFRDSDGDGRIS